MAAIAPLVKRKDEKIAELMAERGELVSALKTVRGVIDQYGIGADMCELTNSTLESIEATLAKVQS